MDSIEFNKRWEKFLAQSHYGLAFNDEKVIEFLDDLFIEIEELDFDFEYYQIKVKFGSVRFYSNLGFLFNDMIEKRIQKIMDKNDGS